MKKNAQCLQAGSIPKFALQSFGKWTHNNKSTIYTVGALDM